MEDFFCAQLLYLSIRLRKLEHNLELLKLFLINATNANLLKALA